MEEFNEQEKREIRLRSRRRRAHHSRLSLILVAVLLAVFVANLITRDRDFSADENRTLAGKPEMAAPELISGDYGSAYEDYYADQFAGRDIWMRLQYTVSHALGRSEFEGVYIGKDGYLLAKPDAVDAAAQERTAEAINRFAAAYPDVNLSMMEVPGAAAVLADKLPRGADAGDQMADVAAFTAMLDPRVQIADTADVLSAHADEEIYYRTDHHWTSKAALYAFQTWAVQQGLEFGAVTYEPLLVSDSFRGTLSSRSGDHSSADEIYVYEVDGTDVIFRVNVPDAQQVSRSVFVREKLEEKDQYQVFLGGNHPLVEIRTTAETGRNLLLFKDSYANCFVQFLTPFYDSITLIDPRYYYSDISGVMNSYGITDVLFLYSADTLSTDTALADTLLAN